VNSVKDIEPCSGANLGTAVPEDGTKLSWRARDCLVGGPISSQKAVSYLFPIRSLTIAC